MPRHRQGADRPPTCRSHHPSPGSTPCRRRKNPPLCAARRRPARFRSVSLTADAGRSTTSPAAMRLMAASSSCRITGAPIGPRYLGFINCHATNSSRPEQIRPTGIGGYPACRRSGPAPVIRWLSIRFRTQPPSRTACQGPKAAPPPAPHHRALPIQPFRCGCADSPGSGPAPACPP